MFLGASRVGSLLREYLLDCLCKALELHSALFCVMVDLRRTSAEILLRVLAVSVEASSRVLDIMVHVLQGLLHVGVLLRNLTAAKCMCSKSHRTRP